MKLASNCREIEKEAKENRKKDLERAINLFKKAGKCFAAHDSKKGMRSTYGNAAKLLWKKARSTRDPDRAFHFYEESSYIYRKMGKRRRAKKIIKEAQKKFIKTAQKIRAGASKKDDVKKAEQQFALASKYFLKGGSKKLSQETWIDAGDHLYRTAREIDDPLEALELFKQSAKNYRNAGSKDKDEKALNEAAVKFYKKGSEIFKTKQDLIQAYYHYTQAANIYIHLGEPVKQVHVEEKVAEIRQILGMSANAILDYLKKQEMHPVSISQVGSRFTPVSPTSSETITSSEEESGSVIAEPSTDIAPEQVVQSTVSEVSNEFQENQMETEKITPVIDISSREIEARSDIHIDDVSKIQPNDKIRNKIREEFLRGRRQTSEESDESKQSEEINQLFDKFLPTKIQDFISIDNENIFSEKNEKPTSSYNQSRSESIVKKPHEPRYDQNNTLLGDDVYVNPEYEILSIIIENHPISIEEIEPKTNISSISMYLSNLKADGLVEQTNDYQYTITEIVEEGLKKQFFSNENIRNNRIPNK